MENTAEIIDGKTIAAGLRHSFKKILEEKNACPALLILQVGDNPASESYIKSKVKACAEVGISSNVAKLPENVCEADLLAFIDGLAKTPFYDGIIVQLPLPKHIDTRKVLEAIPIEKDVDCFNPQNLGKVVQNQSHFEPCTPAGIMELLRFSSHWKDHSKLAHTTVVVVGRSEIVGKPLVNMLINANATVICCHSKTAYLSTFTRRADILISAVGKPNFITPDMISENATIIDVGINRNEENKLVGDVANECWQKAKAITPVPGGVGPMTVAMLLKNTMKAAHLL